MRRDPWYFQRWALEQRVGNATRKLVLNTLAVMAESNTGYCYAKQDDLAFAAECSVRTIGKHLTALEDAGWIARRRRAGEGGHRAPDGFLLLAEGVVAWPDGTEIPTRSSFGLAGAPTGSFRPVQPEPPGAEQNDPGTAHEGESAGASAREALPDGFPAELRPHMEAAYRVLRSLAEAHGAKAISVQSLAAVLMARPRHPIVRAAHDCYAHFIDRQPRRRDVVATYRNWLDHCDPLAATEAMPGATAPAGRPGAVTPIRGPRPNATTPAQDLGAELLADALRGEAAG